MEEGEVPSRRFTRTQMDYEQIRVVGEGTFGQVVLARRNRTKYALKRMNESRGGLSVTTIREIQLLRTMDHPNIIRLVEMVVDGSDVYMVFPYVSHDLNRFIRSNRLEKDDVRHILHQIARGVQYIHGRGVIHRDLKSANILLDRRLHVRIADFGMARHTTKTGMYTPGMVTLWYRAPEVLLGAPYTAAVDVWSLGCIATEMLFGHMVFQGSTELLQLEMIIHACGSINEHSYPGVQDLPGFRAVRLPQSPRRIEAMVEKHDPSAASVVSSMLCINPSRRASIESVCADRYFAESRRAINPH